MQELTPLRRIKYEVLPKPDDPPYKYRGGEFALELLQRTQRRLEEVRAHAPEFYWLLGMAARWLDEAVVDESSKDCSIVLCGSTKACCASELYLAILNHVGAKRDISVSYTTPAGAAE